MTIILTPEQEQAVSDAIRAGSLASVEQFIERAIADLPKGAQEKAVSPGQDLFKQGLGLFGSAEDSALLDDVVALAYEERHRPSKRERDSIRCGV